MFKVTTVNLSSDTTAAATDHGESDLGEMSAVQLTALLERFAAIDPIQNAEADPLIRLSAPAGQFLVRTSLGRLFLYNARNTTEPAAELTPEQIVALVDRPGSPGISPEPTDVSDATTRPAIAPSRGIAIAILCAGLALNGYTLYSAFYTDSVHEKVAVTLLTDPAELAAQKQAVAGTYATGEKLGDRVISITQDGQVSFAEIGNARSISNGADTYRIGRREKKICLTTTDSGIIDVVNIDTLIYYRDTYRRAQ